jgi:hypothetical protein
MYNRYGPMESFDHFVKSWHNTTMAHYRDGGERHMEEYYTPCHAIPQFEFTHFEGKQLVQSVVKQEELKYLKMAQDMPKAMAHDSTIADLPAPVKKALLGMPYTNVRQTSKKWWDYYTQETLDMTYGMYHMDFTAFGYSRGLEQRSDLMAPRDHDGHHYNECGEVNEPNNWHLTL